MKIKPIIWKEYDGVMIGYVGGKKLFSYWYNGVNADEIRKFTLKPSLPYSKMELATREACESASQSILQRFVSQVME